MKIKIDNHTIEIRIDNQAYLNDYKYCAVLIDNNWYKCGLRVMLENGKKKLEIREPYLVDDKTNTISKFYCKGVYAKLEISPMKFYIINHLLYATSFKYKFTSAKRKLRVWLNRVIIFSLAFVLTTTFFYINKAYDNKLIEYIADNIWCQSIIMFLTISSFINIFTPFTLKKEIGLKDVENISSKAVEKSIQEKRIKEYLRKSSTI